MTKDHQCEHDEKRISLEDTIYEIVTMFPELKEILWELGFKEIIKPGMLQTFGKHMNLKKGATAKRLELSEIIVKLEAHGFSVILKEDLR